VRERHGQCVLRKFLGEPDIADDAGEPGYQPCLLEAERRLDDSTRFTFGGWFNHGPEQTKYDLPQQAVVSIVRLQ
jgi:hypothetical protein